MTMNTNFRGRLRNTQLPFTRPLLPLFEAIVNSIHAVEEVQVHEPSWQGTVSVTVLREPQSALQFPSQVVGARSGPAPGGKIVGFSVKDNGVGFSDENMRSFETLDSDHKAAKNCRGVGRLLWLKAFDAASISSTYQSPSGKWGARSFRFTAEHGVSEPSLHAADALDQHRATEVQLEGFSKEYRERAPKTAKAIAHAIVEHCLWYFVRDEGVPPMALIDGDERIDLDDVYDEYMHSQASRETLELGDAVFELTHVKLSGGSRAPSIVWCAAGRVVEEESLVGKIPGLHGKIRADAGDFSYFCYVTSLYLDERVRAERTGFDLEPSLFNEGALSSAGIRNAVLASVRNELADFLDENLNAARARVDTFVSQKAPRYRPVLARMHADIDFDPASSDRELELILHKALSKIEGELIEEGRAVMAMMGYESADLYSARLQSYLAKADDIKKSDLANYVFHRKVILDLLQKAVERGVDGKYAKEDFIHELIMPMKKTSEEIFADRSNLWLIDERLAFHNYLASDKPLSSMPIIESLSGKEPDLCVLNIFDQPLLVSESVVGPFASLTVVEIKRPMRNDAGAGEEKDPVEQALGYLERIRSGKVHTAAGRPITNSSSLPDIATLYAI